MIFEYQLKNPSISYQGFVENTGVEPVTSCLPVLNLTSN